jgi:hypothetical protein
LARFLPIPARKHLIYIGNFSATFPLPSHFVPGIGSHGEYFARPAMADKQQKIHNKRAV